MKYQYLNKKDEHALIKRYQNDNDEEALKELIEFNQLNIFMIITKFINQHTEGFNDAVQEANISLIRAIETFNLESGNRLISYASIIIKNDYFKNTVNNTTIKVQYLAMKFFKQIEEENIIEPIGEISKNYIIASRYNYNTYDIDEYYDDESLCSTDFNIIANNNKELITELLKYLTENERIAIKHRYVLDGYTFMTHEAITNKYWSERAKNNKNRASISGQFAATAMAKLKYIINTKLFKQKWI